MAFRHTHPYDPFLPPGTERLIVGTLPPPRFTTRQLLPGDVDFCYGSRDGLLWPVLEQVFGLTLPYELTGSAIEERKDLLAGRGIGVCDMVARADRDKIDASDTGMKNVKLRDLAGILEEVKTVKALLFTGGNSKNGPEYFFRKHIKPLGFKMEKLSDEVPRIHRVFIGGRDVYTVSLTAPSGSANRAIGAMEAYKMMKAVNPDFTTLDFRVKQYAPYFTTRFWEHL